MLAGGRVLLRRTAGFDLHSVREYEQGESLRKVHWPTTARRGTLMVKELEDTPHDEIGVLLDADARAVVGESFDVQVRAAGSLLRAQTLRSRRAVLTVTSSPPESCHVASFDSEWRLALELLAAVEPTGTEPLARFLAPRSVPGRACVRAHRRHELAQRPARRRAARTGARAAADLARLRRRFELPPRAGAPAREPALLRLQMAGVPVAVLRRGDDLAAKLSGLEEAVTALG